MLWPPEKLRPEVKLQVPFLSVPEVLVSVITPVDKPTSEIVTLLDAFRISVAVTEETPV